MCERLLSLRGGGGGRLEVPAQADAQGQWVKGTEPEHTWRAGREITSADSNCPSVRSLGKPVSTHWLTSTDWLQIAIISLREAPHEPEVMEGILYCRQGYKANVAKHLVHTIYTQYNSHSQAYEQGCLSLWPSAKHHGGLVCQDMNQTATTEYVTVLPNYNISLHNMSCGLYCAAQCDVPHG